MWIRSKGIMDKPFLIRAVISKNLSYKTYIITSSNPPCKIWAYQPLFNSACSLFIHWNALCIEKGNHHGSYSME